VRWERIGLWYVGAGTVLGTIGLGIMAYSAALTPSRPGKLQWFIVALLQATPMIGLGYAIKRRYRWARAAAVALPALIYLVPRFFGLLQFFGDENSLNEWLHRIAVMLQFHIPIAAVLAGVVVWGMAGENVAARRLPVARHRGAEDSAAEVAPSVPPSEALIADPISISSRRWNNVSRLYAFFGGVVGIPLFFIFITRPGAARFTPPGMRSGVGMLSAMLLSVLQLAPMAGLACGVKTRRPWVKAAAIVYPIAIALGLLSIRDRPEPRQGDQLGASYAVMYDLIFSQRYYLPFATALALVVIGLTLVERRARRS
jgi:hypothetical protein